MLTLLLKRHENLARTEQLAPSTENTSQCRRIQMHCVICSGDSGVPLGATEDAVRATHDEREII